MRIKWNESGQEKGKDLQTIIEDKSFWHEDGVIEGVVRKTSDLALFSVKTVELLYKKGLITREDIISLLEGLEDFEGDIEIIDQYTLTKIQR